MVEHETERLEMGVKARERVKECYCMEKYDKWYIKGI
jgi:hypothetical protein